MMSITKGIEKKKSAIKPIVHVAERVRSDEEDKRRRTRHCAIRT